MVLVAFGLVPCLFVVVFVILPPPPPPPPPPSVAAADLLYLSSYAELDTAEGYVICWYFKGGNDKHVCDVSRWVYRRFLVALPHWAAFGPDSVSTPQYLVADITAPEFYLSLSLSLSLSVYLSIYLSVLCPVERPSSPAGGPTRSPFHSAVSPWLSLRARQTRATPLSRWLG